MSNKYKEVFALFNHNDAVGGRLSAPRYIYTSYELAEDAANKLAIIKGETYTIMKFSLLDQKIKGEIKPFITVRMTYNSDYDEYTILSTKNTDEKKELSVQISDDDESITLVRMSIKYIESDTYESIIDRAKVEMKKIVDNRDQYIKN